MKESTKRAIQKYQKEKLQRVPFDVPKEFYEQLKNAAVTSGKSINGYCKEAISEKMQREGFLSDPGEGTTK